MKELQENLRLELHRYLHRLLEPLPLLPRFSLSRTVWVREIWVRGVCLLCGFCLGLISPVYSFFVVCYFFVFLFGFLLHGLWFGFLLHLLVFFLSTSSFVLGFFFVVLFDFFMKVKSLKLKFHPWKQNRVSYT